MIKNTNELPKYAYTLTKKGRRLAEELKQVSGTDNYLLYNFIIKEFLKKPKS